MAIPISTLCDAFRDLVTNRARPDAFREKRGGKWIEISTGRFARSRARSCVVTTTAQAPSLSRQQSKRRWGSAIKGDA